MYIINIFIRSNQILLGLLYIDVSILLRNINNRCFKFIKRNINSSKRFQINVLIKEKNIASYYRLD